MGALIRFECHNCREENSMNIESIETNTICEISFVCCNCGAINNILFDPNDPYPEKQVWVSKPLEGFEWILPSGKIEPIIGDTIYISAFGEHLSRKSYLERYKLDPEMAYQYMRRKRDTQTVGKIKENLSQSISAKPMINLSNIQKIEIRCKNCSSICELNI